MGEYTNTGKLTSLAVFGNPESFQTLIRNHGQLCKIKQAIICPCEASNHGSPDYLCENCHGEGYLYTYQRNFLVVDENSQACGKVLSPYWVPVVSVEKVQNVTSEIQGGITEYTVDTFTDDTITLTKEIDPYQKKRVTYFFDGWTYVESEKLVVDATNGLMYAEGAEYNAGYQSSNPLRAFADIAQVVRIWNSVTGEEITNYTYYGNTIATSQTIVADQMYIEYYYSDLSQVINNDIITRDLNEVFTHVLSSGEVRMAFYPFWDLAKGDVIVMPGTVLWKNETFTHIGDIDKLWEMEIFQLNDVMIDGSGNKYYLDTDYILQGRYVKWISANKPAINAVLSVRYGYKPSFVIFEDNPQPNNLENKLYPKLVLAKSWSKINKDDVQKLIKG